MVKGTGHTSRSLLYRRSVPGALEEEAVSAGAIIRDAIAAAIGIALFVWAVRTQEPDEDDDRAPR